MNNPPAIVNPALVLHHARAWIGTPRARCAALRGVGADCVGLVRGVYAELTGHHVAPPPFRADWAASGVALLDDLRAHLVPVGFPAPAGAVVVYRIGAARAAHVGIASNTDGGLVHLADYAGAVVEDGRFAPTPPARSSGYPTAAWHFPNVDGCERGPDDLDPADCVAVIHRDPEPGAGVFALIQAPDATPLARTRHWADLDAALDDLGGLYSHIETVD